MARLERVVATNERKRWNVLLSPYEVRNLIRLVREELGDVIKEQPKA